MPAVDDEDAGPFWPLLTLVLVWSVPWFIGVAHIIAFVLRHL